ncbi:MAG: polysaccharide biosynthesis tyrosine autokinase [candidate division KSB1 bacterium]|nr:polysaccharide biosynthesis tyrosine autokinase [candidate division KSB1 bacterium]
MSESFTHHMAKVLGLAIQSSDSVYRFPSEVFSEYETTENPVEARYRLIIDESGNYKLYQKQESGAYVAVDSANAWDAVDSPREINGIKFKLQPDFAHREQRFHFRVRPFIRGVKILRNITKEFSRSGKTMVMTMKGEDPQALARELNRIADGYLIEMQRLKMSDSENAREILKRRLAVAEANMRRSEQNLRDFYARYPLSLELEKKDLLEKIKANERDLQELPRQRRQLTNLLTRLQTPEGEKVGSPYRNLVVSQIANFPPLNNEPEIIIHRQNLEMLQKRYQELSAIWAADNPQVIEVVKQITETQEQIIQFANDYRNTLAERESELRAQKVELERKLKTLPDDEYRLMELERTKAINEDLYKMLFSESQKRLVAESSREAGIRILDYAVPPTSPDNPSKRTKVLMGGGLGLLLGILLSALIDIFDRSLRTSRDVERYLNLPVIGAIPYVSFKDIPEYRDDQKALQIDRQLVTHDYAPTPVGEAYRALRTSLLYSKDTENIRALLITSISPEEGKSFTASNLAIILAQQRTNTLLIDADLRRGVLHNTFNIPKEPGLTNYLTNKAMLSSLIHPTHIPNLSIISCGPLVPNPSELLGSLQMRRLVAEVKRKFDYIIFDAPPLDAATDSVVIATLVDAVAIVVKSGQTNFTTAKERLQVFKTVPAKIIGVIINSAQESILKSSYSYYHY